MIFPGLKQKGKSILAIVNTMFTRNSFYSFGKSKIYFSAKIDGSEFIAVGNGVVIREYSWLLALKGSDKTKRVLIEIEDNAYLGHQIHIVAIQKVKIGKNVLIADKVFISDCNHNYENIDIPIKEQGVQFKKIVILNENCWIGENVCIVGASVGRNSVVSANSVVTHDVPDYCVVAGVPGRIIKRYSFEKKKWLKTNEKGEFSDE
jgi:acetyltransferase-like isoleucine patch superfamily enzyme